MTILEQLENAIRTLPKAQAPVKPSKIAAWVRSVPFHELVSADQACEQFALDSHWPRVSNNVLAQIHLRLECAVSLIQADFVPMGKPIPPEEMLDMLLLKFWHGHGIEWVEHTYGGRRS